MAKKKANFLDPPQENAKYVTSRVAVLPVPFETTTTYGKGTKNGPAAIINASAQVEFYDEEIDFEAYPCGISTLPELKLKGKKGREAALAIESATAKILSDKKLPVILGGEHSITLGSVKACLKKYPGLTVVQIDAHSDLREEYLGNPYSHASVMKRILDAGAKTIQIGIRAQCVEERRFIEEKGLTVIYAHEMTNNDWQERVIPKIGGPVYLTVDVDGIDPSVIPSTGTPVPGGIMWYPLMDFLRKVIRRSTLVGFDVVELLPNRNHHASEFAAARLIYKIISYWWKEGLK